MRTEAYDELHWKPSQHTERSEHHQKGGVAFSDTGSSGRRGKGKIGLDDGSDLPSMPKGGVGGGGSAEYDKGRVRDRRPSQTCVGKEGKKGDVKGSLDQNTGKGLGDKGERKGCQIDDDWTRMSSCGKGRHRPYNAEEARNLARIFEGKGKSYDFGARYPPREFYKDTFHFSKDEMEEWLEDNKELLKENLITFTWEEPDSIHGTYHCALCPNNVLENWGCLCGHISGGPHNRKLRSYRQPHGGPPLLDDDAEIRMPWEDGSAGPGFLRGLVEEYRKEKEDSAHQEAPSLASLVAEHNHPCAAPSNPQPSYASVDITNSSFPSASPPPLLPGADSTPPPPLPTTDTSLIYELNALRYEAMRNASRAPPQHPHEADYELPPPPGAYEERFRDPAAAAGGASGGPQNQGASEPSPLPGACAALVGDPPATVGGAFGGQQNQSTCEPPPPPGACAARVGDPQAAVGDAVRRLKQYQSAYEMSPPSGAYAARLGDPSVSVDNTSGRQQQHGQDDMVANLSNGDGGVVDEILSPTPSASEPLRRPDVGEPQSCLQPGWERVDDEVGNRYYYNVNDHRIQWGRPSVGLPEHWGEFVDASTGRSYFQNVQTDVVTWTHPK